MHFPSYPDWALTRPWFKGRDEGLMHLDRDDRGNSNNTILINGKKVINPLRQEVVTIRSIVPGEYVVNAHYYETKDIDTSDPKAGQPVLVTLSIIKVNPKAEVVFYGQATLEGRVGLAGHRCLATLVMASGAPIAATRLEPALEQARQVSVSDSNCHVGVTSPHPRVVVARVLCDQTEPARRILQEIWAAWRQVFWALKPEPSRMWRV